MAKPVRHIPISVTKVEVETGKETNEPGAWTVLPPAKDKCQICAVDHAPCLPHNAQSIYYQMTFQGQIGRPPTWADAMAHCDDEMKRKWKEALIERGAWSEPPEGEAPVLHHGVE